LVGLKVEMANLRAVLKVDLWVGSKVDLKAVLKVDL